MKWWLMIPLAVALSVEASPKKKLDPDIADLMRACGKEKGCRAELRESRILTENGWEPETMIFVRSKTISELGVARYKGTTGSYVVIMIPIGVVDIKLMKFFGGE